MRQKLFLELLDNNINLYCFDISKKKEVLLILMQYMLQNDLFISLTIHENEVSIISDSKIEEYIDTNDYTVRKNFKAIKIYDTCENIEQIGIVAKISNLLTAIDIPILYINSFNSNFVIIEEEHINKALLELNKQNFKII